MVELSSVKVAAAFNSFPAKFKAYKKVIDGDFLLECQARPKDHMVKISLKNIQKCEIYRDICKKISKFHISSGHPDVL